MQHLAGAVGGRRRVPHVAGGAAAGADFSHTDLRGETPFACVTEPCVICENNCANSKLHSCFICLLHPLRLPPHPHPHQRQLQLQLQYQYQSCLLQPAALLCCEPAAWPLPWCQRPPARIEWWSTWRHHHTQCRHCHSLRRCPCRQLARRHLPSQGEGTEAQPRHP